MFATLDEAKAAFAEFMDPPHIAVIAGLLQPVTGAFATDAPVAPARSQIGGTPLAGPNLDWPIVDPAALAPTASTAGAPEANAQMRAHLDARVPMSFVARIELSQANAIPALAALPDQGQLLFFYDFVLGPYDDGAATGRVIWDQTASTDLAPVPLPPALTRAAAEARAEIAAINKEYGFETDWDGFTTIYDTSGRQAALVAGFGLPSPYAAGPDGLPAPLAEALQANAPGDAETEMLARYMDAFYAARESGADPVLRLLSAPLPEQDDPRLAVVTLERFGRPLNREEWLRNYDQIIAGLGEWRVLAQLDIAGWLDDAAEGQVYFLIRADDLAAQRFDRVQLVYQQT